MMLQLTKRILNGLAGGVGCAVAWWLLDEYLFGNIHSMDYYVTVVFAYLAGTGPLSGLKKQDVRS